MSTQDNKIRPPLCRGYENAKDLLHVFDSYIPKHISGADGDGSYELSDVDDEMNNKDKEKDSDGDLVRSEEGGNDLDDNINVGTKGMEEVDELVKSALSKENIDNFETQIKEKDDEQTKTTREVEAQII